MNSYSILCIFLCYIGSFFGEFQFYVNSQTRDENLFLGKYRIPNKMTPDPINIPTNKAKKIKLPPLKILNVNFKDSMNLTNNGKAVEAIVDPNTEQIITGGPFYSNKFKYYKTRFYFSDDPKIPAATTIDGVGTQLEAVVYGYNKKYQTWNNALHHPDGISVISIGIAVELKPNKLYPPFPKELREVKHPGSSIIVPHKDTGRWDSQIPEDEIYYTYPGAYTDLVNKKVYFSATVCVLRPVNAYMSRKQFENSFGKLKKFNGKRLVTSNKTIPLNGRPIVESSGFKQTFVR